MLAQQPLSWRLNQAEIGKVVDVLVEQEHPGGNRCIGRSARFAPEVDGLVYIEGHAPLNQIVSVAITAADTYDLFWSGCNRQGGLAQHAVSVRFCVNSSRGFQMTLSFSSLGLSEARVSQLEKLGYNQPTNIQAEAIPHFALGTRLNWSGPNRHREKPPPSLYR